MPTHSCFRVLLLSEICEALGDELQYTVLAFIPPYVIQPATLDSGTVYLLLAGTVLVFQLSTIPFWMFLGQRFGKYKGYLAYVSVFYLGIVASGRTVMCFTTARAAIMAKVKLLYLMSR